MHSMRAVVVSVLLFLASVAQGVTITSVTPSSGPTSGGTQITLKGTDFGTCPNCSPALPPFVKFGDSAWVMSQMIDSTTLVVTLPPHSAGTVTVQVAQWDGDAELANAFTYQGEFPQEAMERILLPLLTAPVFGGFGSEFHTDLRIEHRFGPGYPVSVYGLTPVCHLSVCIPWDSNNALPVELPITSDQLVANGSPGRFLYVDPTEVNTLAMNLRVHDVSRAGLNFGTEMPIVRERDFIDPAFDIVLVGVPTDARFRNTLRIYGVKGDRARITVEGETPQDVQLQGGSNPFEPAYAIFSNFPVGTGTPRRVTITLANSSVPPLQKTPFWAFITVTNNETQMITTITPRP